MKKHTRLEIALSTLLVLLGGSCSSGSSGESGDAAFTLALTDAASDELVSFVVEVDAVELTRPGGAAVGVLPAPITVDLATLVDVSQVLNVVNVPPGLYSGATITLDFGAAEAYVVGQTAPATLLDGDGNALAGSVELPVTVPNSLSAVAGRNRVLELDFDLDQSVVVDSGANQVFVEPVLVLRVDRNDPKELIVAGVIEAVDAPAGTIDVELQTLGGVPVCDWVIQVGPSTVYQVDGEPAQGVAGLSLLAALPPGAWIQCYGAVHPMTGRLAAVYVEAGAGTYNGGSDIVEGFIVERVGGAGVNPVLTVLGHSNDETHTSFQFNTSFTVNASFANTNVARRGWVQPLDTDELNIGQRVRCFGDLAGVTLNATAADAVIRQEPTRILGYANGPVAGGTLAIDLARIEFRDAAAFTWADGGTSPPDPDDLRAAVGGLATGLNIVQGTALEVHGYFTAVDDAGDDFEALSLVNRDLAPSLIALQDRANGLVVEPTVTSTELTLAISGSAVIGEFALLDRGFVSVTELPASPAPTIAPAGAHGLYFLRDRSTGAVSLQLDFAAFAQALDALLAQGAGLYNLGAVGAYDAPTNAMLSGLIVVTVD